MTFFLWKKYKWLCNYAEITSSFSICVWGIGFSCNWIKSGFDKLSWIFFLPWKTRGRPLLCWFGGLNISGSRSLWSFFFGIPEGYNSSCHHILLQKGQRGAMVNGGKVASVSWDKKCFQIHLGEADMSHMAVPSCKGVYDSKHACLFVFQTGQCVAVNKIKNQLVRYKEGMDIA